jgi:sensor c-di-GMP phosphodiesterase-like protein
MSGFVNPFVSGRHRRLVELVIWLAITLALLAVGAAILRSQMHDALEREAKAKLTQFDTLHASVASAFDELHRTATSEPCSDQFIRELRRVAFKPDGLNEFMYAPNGIVTCSTSINAQQPGASLGPPDVEATGDGGVAFWINKTLDSVGLTGVTGSVAFQEPFALVIPPQGSWADRSSWVRKEFVFAAGDGRVWHLGGEDGIFAAAAAPHENDAPLSTMHAVACGKDHGYCVAVKADALETARTWRTELALAVGLIAFYAFWPASVTCRALERYWSLEQRFRRNLTSESVVCAYQPILDLRTGEISGCEVLARWRDVDGSIVSPDRFVDIVAKSGDTLAFTKMVADKAFEEVSRTLPRHIRLQLNFNIFPRDLDSARLRETFRAFEAERDRFPLALEIVESDALSVDAAQREIEALAEHGIRTYIDDFGSGYSSIHRVASLAIHGVKLDRSFAMAPNESLMARMLVHALDMIGSSGREIVVEGVETQERLDLLIGTKRVAYAQGYLISRPLPIDRLAAFLARHDAATALMCHARAAA